jgi:hypothetical protein
MTWLLASAVFEPISSALARYFGTVPVSLDEATIGGASRNVGAKSLFQDFTDEGFQSDFPEHESVFEAIRRNPVLEVDVQFDDRLPVLVEIGLAESFSRVADPNPLAISSILNCIADC